MLNALFGYFLLLYARIKSFIELVGQLQKGFLPFMGGNLFHFIQFG